MQMKYKLGKWLGESCLFDCFDFFLLYMYMNQSISNIKKIFQKKYDKNKEYLANYHLVYLPVRQF